MIRAHHIKHLFFFVSLFGLLGSMSFLTIQASPVNASTTETISIEYQTFDDPTATVTSSPAGINCPGTCSYDFPTDSQVVLTASSLIGYTFTQWRLLDTSDNLTDTCTEGTINYKGNVCTVDLGFWSNTDAVTARVNATTDASVVSTTVAGDGSGSVTSSPAGINCPGTCSASFSTDSSMTLTAAPASGSTFAGWATSAEGGTQCLIYEEGGEGKGGGPASSSRNTASTCTLYPSKYSQTNGVPIAYFEKAAATPEAPAADTPATPDTTPETQTQDVESTGENADDVETTGDTETDKDSILLNGNTYSSDEENLLQFAKDEIVKISGFAEPDTTIKLYIYSEPKTATVQTDSEGYWEYEIADLEPGSHRVESAVIDAVSGEESEPVLIAQFSVDESEPAQDTASAPSTNSSSPPTNDESGSNKTSLIVAATLVGIAALGYIAWYWLHHKNSLLSHHKTENPQQTAPDPQDPTIN